MGHGKHPLAAVTESAARYGVRNTAGTHCSGHHARVHGTRRCRRYDRAPVDRRLLLLGLFTGQRQTDRLRMKDESDVEGRHASRQSKTGQSAPCPAKSMV
ncbi:hypothetical protein CWO90_15075 [Bradyrhizobium sp. Leo121]|nr:hypothetical protein CWO90_15075 [Bradyrhizobium sp. Leo121]